MAVRKAKFRVGQVVSPVMDKTHPPWFGIVNWVKDGTTEVSYADGDCLEYDIGELRPLTKREQGRRQSRRPHQGV